MQINQMILRRSNDGRKGGRMTDDAYESGMPPLSVEFIREQMRCKGAGVSKCVENAATLRDDIRKRKVQLKKDAFLMRKNMRTEAQDTEALLNTFKNYRQHEQDTPSVLDEFNQKLGWTQEDIEKKVLNYQKNIEDFRNECVRLRKKSSSSVDNEDLKQALEEREHDLGQAIKDFEKTLIKLEQEAKEPMFELAAALHHLDMLCLATRDLFENTSWEEVPEGMDTLWQAFQKAFDSLIDIINGLLYPSKDVAAENAEPEPEAVEAALDEEDDLVTIELNTLPTEPPDPRPPALSLESLNEKIESFLKRLGDIRKQEGVDIKQEKQARNIGFFSNPPTPQAMTALQADVTKVLIRAKQQEAFEPTPIQHAALQELRAEAQRMITEVNPSAAKKGWDEVRKRSEEGVVSVKETFKSWAEERVESEDEQDKPQGKKPSGKNN